MLLVLGGIHYFPHEERTLDLMTVDDKEEGPVQSDAIGHKTSYEPQNCGPSSFGPSLVDGQHRLVQGLEAQKQS